MEEWEINKPLGECSGTGKKIEAGEEYFAALVETAEGLQRRDFCAEYWQKEKPSVFCYWKTKLPEPNQKKQIFVDDEMLMSFFERLEGETDAEKVSFRFVLALILMRKRRFKYEGAEKKDDKEIWRLRISGDKQIVEVENPNLDEEKLKQMSAQIGHILQVNL